MRTKNHKWTAESTEVAVNSVLDNYRFHDIKFVYAMAADEVNEQFASSKNPETTANSVSMGFQSAAQIWGGAESHLKTSDMFREVLAKQLEARNISRGKFLAIFG